MFYILTYRYNTGNKWHFVFVDIEGKVPNSFASKSHPKCFDLTCISPPTQKNKTKL